MKRILSFTLILIMVLSLAACGGTGPSDTRDEDEDGGDTSVAEAGEDAGDPAGSGDEAVSLTAVKVGDTSYSAAELNVFYRNTYSLLYSSYGEYASFFIDPESEEWKQQVYDQTILTMTDVTALYDDAVANGYALTGEDQASIDGQLSEHELYAAMSGYSTDDFIAGIYGEGVNKKTLESVLTRIVVAQSWSQRKLESMTYTQEQLDSYYAGHAGEYDYINFYYYPIYTDDEFFADVGDDETRKTSAHAAAAVIAAAADEDGFIALAREFHADAAPGEQHIQGSSVSAYYGDYSDWLLDPGRKAGDTTVIDTEGASAALLFIARDGNDYHLQAMRHILIKLEPETDGDGNTVYTGEAARARIEEIRAEYETDPTEEHFAALADEYSEDAGSNTNGGLYETIYRGQMVPNIDDFLFGGARKPGDIAVLFGESPYYQGWHLVYYAGEGPVYKDYIAGNALRNADYASYLEALTAPYEVATGAGLEYASLT